MLYIQTQSEKIDRTDSRFEYGGMSNSTMVKSPRLEQMTEKIGTSSCFAEICPIEGRANVYRLKRDREWFELCNKSCQKADIDAFFLEAKKLGYY